MSLESINTSCKKYFHPDELWNEKGIKGKAQAIGSVLSYFTILIPAIIKIVEVGTANSLKGRLSLNKNDKSSDVQAAGNKVFENTVISAQTIEAKRVKKRSDVNEEYNKAPAVKEGTLATLIISAQTNILFEHKKKADGAILHTMSHAVGEILTDRTNEVVDKQLWDTLSSIDDLAKEMQTLLKEAISVTNPSEKKIKMAELEEKRKAFDSMTYEPNQSSINTKVTYEELITFLKQKGQPIDGITEDAYNQLIGTPVPEPVMKRLYSNLRTE